MSKYNRWIFLPLYWPIAIGIDQTACTPITHTKTTASCSPTKEIELCAHISAHDIYAIGIKIWRNECNADRAKLTHWNPGEPCASCGIGHFIWYPADAQKIYKETFPALLQFFVEHQVLLPSWLHADAACPWPNKQAFDAACSSKPMQQLRNLLAETIELQTYFILHQAEQRVNIMLNQCTPTERSLIKKKLTQLLAKPPGVFAIIDYINFKGDGTCSREQYQNCRWGLLQVLQKMADRDCDPLEEFVRCAQDILTRRVHLAPPENHEERWLAGWHNRIERYKNSE